MVSKTEGFIFEILLDQGNPNTKAFLMQTILFSTDN